MDFCEAAPWWLTGKQCLSCDVEIKQGDPVRYDCDGESIDGLHQTRVKVMCPGCWDYKQMTRIKAFKDAACVAEAHGHAETAQALRELAMFIGHELLGERVGA